MENNLETTASINAQLIAEKVQYLKELESARVEILTKLGEKNLNRQKTTDEVLADNVAKKMKKCIETQNQLLKVKEVMDKAEINKMQPSIFVKKSFQILENRFLKNHNEFENEFNNSHAKMAFNDQKISIMISKQKGVEPNFAYNRDRLDNLVAHQCEKIINNDLIKESFSKTISESRYVKGDFANRYIDSKIYNETILNKDVNVFLKNTDMLSVKLKKAITNNENIIMPSRPPRSKEEQALLNAKIKTCIVTNMEEMASFIEETKIEKELAKQELALENSRFQLGSLAEKAFVLQENIVSKREDRKILFESGNDLSAKDRNKLVKDEAKLDKLVNTIDKKLDTILTFNKHDKEDYWQQIEIDGKERYKRDFEAFSGKPLPDETLLSTMQQSKGQLALSNHNDFQNNDINLVSENVTITSKRVKTNIVKIALEKEKSLRPRELSPDPKNKEKKLEAKKAEMPFVKKTHDEDK